MKIFLLEDELSQQIRVEKHIAEIAKELEIKLEVISTGKISEFENYIQHSDIHQLYFLDIHIQDNEYCGLEIAQKIREANPYAIIVFITTKSEFASITYRYKVSALDFIDKTLGEEEFKERISLAIDYTLEQAGTTIAQDAFTFESAMARVQVPFNKILYVETSPTIHKVILHTQEERLEFYASIADIEKADTRLYRCHRSFVVNPQNITKIDKEAKKAFLENGDNCLISRTKYRGLLEALKK